MKDNKIVQLSDVEHVLKRSARYLGSTVQTKVSRFYIENEKIIFGEIEYVPALLKLIREIIDNSIDEGLRTQFKFANTIKITISKDTVIVEDNGRGIPVVFGHDSAGNEIQKYMPDLAWTSLRSGSNFSDTEEDDTIGQNGEGSSLCNIWSKEFIGETADGKKYFKVHCKQNLSSSDIHIEDSKKQFTKVTFKPDLERMQLESISDIYMDLLEFDLLFLKETYKEIKFEFKRK